ncbi:hypothetical protein DLM77_21180 [Leptospira yasudae]|uniref:Hint domain-containing protein n=1 Tax=Leptospira yasudae TaxID=2202201 RepID=A0ABX9LX71_9LEPT|nr:hypothetical protein DLM77_21180 [Leptospira yasudae]
MTGAESALSGKRFERSRLTSNTIYHSNQTLSPKPGRTFTLSHQFKGSDTLSIGYNTNTHGFSPIGVNGNFINDLNLSLIQEHAAKGNADAIKKLADYYGNVLVERGVISAEKMGELMTKSGGHEELISLYDSNKQTAFANGDNSPEAIKWKSETTQAVEQLRSEGLNIKMGGQSQSGGFFNDLFTSFQNSMGNATNGNGGFDTNGAFSIRTCFTAGTLVHTQTGTKRIEEVTVGDVVLSWNEATGKQEYNRVTETFVKETEEIFTLLFSDGKQLETTWNHPFRRLLPQYKSETLPTKENSEWVAAKDLKEGDLTFTKDGRVLSIGYIQVDDRDEKVYNFSVEKEHDYYVGEDGILVHNEGCGPMTGPVLSPQVMSTLLKFLPGATDAELETAKRLIEIGNRPVDGSLEAAFDLAGYIDAACKNGCPPDIAMAPLKLGISATKLAGELIRSGRFREAVQVTAAAAKNWFKGADNFNPLITELNRLGIKNSPGEIVGIARDVSGRIVFLERGNQSSGLAHIIGDHGTDFLNKGILQSELPDFIMKAATEGKVVGYVGAGTGRPVYEIIYKGQKQTVGITIGSNGYIVGANPASSYRPL